MFGGRGLQSVVVWVILCAIKRLAHVVLKLNKKAKSLSQEDALAKNICLQSKQANTQTITDEPAVFFGKRLHIQPVEDVFKSSVCALKSSFPGT